MERFVEGLEAGVEVVAGEVTDRFVLRAARPQIPTKWIKFLQGSQQTLDATRGASPSVRARTDAPPFEKGLLDKGKDRRNCREEDQKREGYLDGTGL